MTFAVIAGIGGVALISAFCQAVSGFGFALVAVPLLAMITGPITAVVAVTMMSCLLCLGMSVQQREHVDWRALRVVVPTGILGMPLGLIALRVVDPRWISLGIGMVVIAFTFLLARGLTFTGHAPAAIAGVVSGILLTSTSMNGPPLVIAFQGNRLAPERFRATLQAAFSVHDVVAIAGFAIAGVLTPESLRALGIGIAPAAVGWLLGGLVVRKIDAILFRRIVFGLLAATGIVSVVSAVVGA